MLIPGCVRNLIIIAAGLFFVGLPGYAQTSDEPAGLSQPALAPPISSPRRLSQASPVAPLRPALPTRPPTVEPGKPTMTQPLLLRPAVEKSAVAKPFTLSGAVRFADSNYPAILRGQAETRAAKYNVTVQKLTEYMPDSLMQFQEVLATHNKLTQILYGSPVFPANPGPGFTTTSMNPLFFSGFGFNLDWSPIDFGLHRARIGLAKEQYRQTAAQYGVTRLDAQVAAAGAFLDVVEALAQIRATEENVKSFEQFATVVQAQVTAKLKPGADAALADAQLANARNQLFRAQLNYDVAKASLENALGIAGVDIEIDSSGLPALQENAEIQRAKPVFSDVPILQAAKETILTAIAQKGVLSHEYYPTIHWMFGVQTRGAALNTTGHDQSSQLKGLLPAEPNYQIAMIVNWNFLDAFRLHYEKKVQDQRILAQQHEYNLVLQNLITQDARSRAQVRTAILVAENMPVQVAAASTAVSQAVTRYQVGLGGVAQVAEANQVLAQSRMQEAVARVAVWRAMLAVAAVHGDLGPFLAEADRIQRGI